jgi:multidrug transporter EmrE-like cation transporter
MNKSIFTIAVIASMAILLIILNQLNVLTQYSVFALIPVVGAYFLGQFGEKKFKK